MDSILASVKQMLGVTEDYDAFDLDIITDINATFMILNQLGVGPKGGFVISGNDETWPMLTDREDLSAIQTYVYMRVRLMFDPPSNSFIVESFNKQIAEFEWRLRLEVEGGPDYEPESK